MQTPQGESVLGSARTVTTYLLREPVKQAVREAIHEETTTVERGESSDAEPRDDESKSDQGSDDTSRTMSPPSSKRSAGVVLLAIGGLTYLLRRRMRSGGGGGGLTPSGSRRTDRAPADRSTATGPETPGSATTEN